MSAKPGNEAELPLAGTPDISKTVKIKKPEDFSSGHRQRLRERFLNGGTGALADYELLEMALFAARPRGDVKPLAKRLLNHFKTLAKVLRADANELRKVEGVGEAGVASLKLIAAAAEKMLQQEVTGKTVIQSWTGLLDYCRVTMAHKKNEEFRILFLNHKNALMSDEVQQTGTVDHTPVYPREVVRRALELGASSIILVHNHPSGEALPSDADVDITKQVIAACKPVGIEVHDHLIVASGGHFSFRSHELI